MITRVKKESILVVSLFGIIVFMLVTLTIFGSSEFNVFQATKKTTSKATLAKTTVATKRQTPTATSTATTNITSSNKSLSVYESLNQRINASVNDKVSDYKIKDCTFINHSDGEKLKVCIADFTGNTTGFYDSAQELLMLSSFDNRLLIHEIFHATSLHFIRKGMTNFGGHEEQEKMAYNAEFLYEQIMSFKSDLITAETNKKLSSYYK